MRKMGLHGPVRYVHALADLGIGQALGDQARDGALGRGEAVPADLRPAAGAAAATPDPGRAQRCLGTVFNTGPHANTTDFRAGDVGLVRRNLGHYVENTGDDTLIFIETFRSDHYEEVSLANWLAHLPPKLVTAHLNIPGETLATFPRGAQGIVPLP